MSLEFSKILELKDLTNLLSNKKKEGYTVGLITGCFDVIHIGHIELFQFAKENCDILVVGIENDQTLRLSKGANRPIHDQSQRATVLAELCSVNYVFINHKVIRYDSNEAEESYINLVKEIKPNYLISNTYKDPYWREKAKRAKLIGAKFLGHNTESISSTTRILNFFKE